MKKKSLISLLVPIMALGLAGCDDPNEGLSWASVIEKAEAKLGLDLAVLPEPTGNTKLEYSEQTNKVTIKAHYKESKLATYIGLLEAASFEVDSNVAIHEESEIRVALNEEETNLLLEVSKYEAPIIPKDPMDVAWEAAIAGVEAGLQLTIGELPRFAPEGITGYGHRDVYKDGSYCITLEGFTYEDSEGTGYPIELDADAKAYAELLMTLGFAENEDYGGVESPDGTYVVTFYNIWAYVEELDDYELQGATICIYALPTPERVAIEWEMALAAAEADLEIDLPELPILKDDATLGFTYYEEDKTILVKGDLLSSAVVDAWHATLPGLGYEKAKMNMAEEAYFAAEDAYAIYSTKMPIGIDWELWEYIYGTVIVFDLEAARYTGGTIAEEWLKMVTEASADLEVDLTGLPVLWGEGVGTYKYLATTDEGYPALGLQFIESSSTVGSWFAELVSAHGFESGKTADGRNVYFAEEDAYCLWYDYDDNYDYIYIELEPERFSTEALELAWAQMLTEATTDLAIDLTDLPFLWGDGVTTYTYLETTDFGYPALGLQTLDSTGPANTWLAGLVDALGFESGKTADGREVYFAPEDAYCLWYRYDANYDYIFIEVAPERLDTEGFELAWAQMLTEATTDLAIDLTDLPLLWGDGVTTYTYLETTTEGYPALGLQLLNSTAPVNTWLAGLVTALGFEAGKNADGREVYFAPNDAYCLWYGWDDNYDYIYIELDPERYVAPDPEDLDEIWASNIAAIETELGITIGELPMLTHENIIDYGNRNVYGDTTYCITLEGSFTFTESAAYDYPLEGCPIAIAYAELLKTEYGFTEGVDPYGDMALISPDGTYGLGLFNIYSGGALIGATVCFFAIS